MKYILARTLLVSAIVLPLVNPLYAASETYTLDPGHTYVLWHINHFGFSNPSGKWVANGTLVLDETQPQHSKVNVVINTTTVDTGVPALDEHIRSKALLDTTQFPTATFISNKITLTGKDKAKVTGTLTLHGVSKPITLDVTLNKIGVSPITNKKTAGFSASAVLNRSDYGITALLPGVSDEVKINIEAEGEVAS